MYGCKPWTIAKKIEEEVNISLKSPLERQFAKKKGLK
jgi:hypothetical protein